MSGQAGAMGSLVPRRSSVRLPPIEIPSTHSGARQPPGKPEDPTLTSTVFDLVESRSGLAFGPSIHPGLHEPCRAVAEGYGALVGDWLIVVLGHAAER